MAAMCHRNMVHVQRRQPVHGINAVKCGSHQSQGGGAGREWVMVQREV